MQDKQENKKADDSSDTSNSVVKPITSPNIRQIQRLRLALLILTAICFGYVVVIAITVIYNSSVETCQETIVSLFIDLVFIVLYAVGFYSTYKYYVDGLSAFVSVGIALLGFTGAILVDLMRSSPLEFPDRRSFAIRLFVFFDLMVIIVHIALKFIYLLDPNGL